MGTTLYFMKKKNSIGNIGAYQNMVLINVAVKWDDYEFLYIVFNFYAWLYFCTTLYLLRFTTGLAATLLLWPTITEQLHLTRNVHRDINYDCPTAKTGLLGGGAFLSLDSSLLWLIALMLADNAREDFFDEGEDGDKGEYGTASSEAYYDAAGVKDSTWHMILHRTMLPSVWDSILLAL